MAQEEKSAPDWERIEADYRAGVLSVREIAAPQGITEGAIRKRAKKEGWKRAQKPQRTPVVLEVVDDSLDASGFVYLLMIDSGVDRFFKIGMAEHFGMRFSQHQCSSPFPLHVVCCYYTGNMRAEERSLHAQYASKRVRGEWFRLDFADLQAISQRSLLLSHE